MIKSKFSQVILANLCLVAKQILFLNECSEDEVNTIIRELQNGKSSDIPIGVIKKTSKIISPILSSHFNYLMKVGKFPDELKLGKITKFTRKKVMNF